ncbi:MAG TPA: M28 family peptidase, partial [Candidatus Thermoplasmatota archaeon]|nr:M28 family peptidase [Candidatus Thermoplasmatota archaeon]
RFNATRAMDFVRAQLAAEDGSFRDRIPGTPGNRAVATLIRDTVAGYGWNASFDPFVATYGCEPVRMQNVVATLNPNASKTLIVGTHFDSRPIAEKDPDPAKRDLPTPGANDGAAGTGALVELARVLADRVRNVTLLFVFYDGEDGGGYRGDACTDWILGSRHHAATVDPAEVQGMILLDLIGSENLSLPREGVSREGANRALQDRLWSIAGGLGYASVFKNSSAPAITDDHVPYAERGIPSVDIIDLRPGASDARGLPTVFFKWHHTREDTIEHVDPASLAMVGRVVERYVIELDRAG